MTTQMIRLAYSMAHIFRVEVNIVDKVSEEAYTSETSAALPTSTSFNNRRAELASS
jgi:hypothetical protein